MTMWRDRQGLPRFVLDCGFNRRGRIAGASLAAVGLHAVALGYCNDAGTDGTLPPDIATLAISLGVREVETKRAVDELVRRGVWLRRPDALLIVGFLDHNPSKAEVESYRSSRAERGKRGNHKRWHAEHPDPECRYCDPLAIVKGSSKDSHNDRPTNAQCSAVQSSGVDTSSSSRPPVNSPAPTTNGGEEASIVRSALAVLAQRRMERRSGPPINDVTKWTEAAIAGLRTQFGDLIGTLDVSKFESGDQLAEYLEPLRQPEVAAETDPLDATARAARMREDRHDNPCSSCGGSGVLDTDEFCPDCHPMGKR